MYLTILLRDRIKELQIYIKQCTTFVVVVKDHSEQKKLADFLCSASLIVSYPCEMRLNMK